MPDQDRRTDRAGRRAKRFLNPSQKYEIYLQLVSQKLTMAEAAEAWQVDRSTTCHPHPGQGGCAGGPRQLPARPPGTR